MAQIRLMSWNIEVYGPKKYAETPNNSNIIRFAARTAVSQNANILVLQELMSGVAEQVCFSICEQLRKISKTKWRYASLATRPGGDREAHGIFWRTDRNFAITVDGDGASNIMLSELDFPNKWAKKEGRRPLIAVFRSTDTNTYFAVTNYHAPAVTNQAAQGPQLLAETVALYRVDDGGNERNVTRRLLAGDYNLGATHPEFGWLTNPVPALPPPVQAGEGAGTTALLPTDVMYTHYPKLDDVVHHWGNNLAGWSRVPADYRDLQLDNIYCAPAPAGSVVDMMAAVMAYDGVGLIARLFQTTYPGGQPAFPNAARVPQPLHLQLADAPCAYLVYRYAISDHLPVFVTATI